MNKSESKFYNTSLKFNDALLELLFRKNFADISISEICKTAGLNRSTFYSHYSNTKELLNETSKRFINDYHKRFLNNESSPINNDCITENNVRIYLQFIKENRKKFLAFSKNLEIIVDKNKVEAVRNVVKETFSKDDIGDEKMVNYAFSFYMTGIQTVTLDWAKNNCTDSIDYMISVIFKCIGKKPD